MSRKKHIEKMKARIAKANAEILELENELWHERVYGSNYGVRLVKAKIARRVMKVALTVRLLERLEAKVGTKERPSKQGVWR